MVNYRAIERVAFRTVLLVAGLVLFGLAFTPVFYVISTGLAELRFKWRKRDIETPAFTPD